MSRIPTTEELRILLQNEHDICIEKIEKECDKEYSTISRSSNYRTEREVLFHKVK